MLGSQTVSEAAAAVGLSTVVILWSLGGGGPADAVGLAAFAVLCIRMLAAAAADLLLGPAAVLLGQHPQETTTSKAIWGALSAADDTESLPPLTTRRNRVEVPAGGSAPPPGSDAARVGYMPFSTTPLPPGTIVPKPQHITVADKLDTTLSVFDFIPLKYHAGIRLNKRIGAGNVDVTTFFQAAIDFVGQNGGPGQTPMTPLVIDIPAGRYYISNILLAHGIVLRGAALQATMLCCMPGTKGSWLKNYTTGPPNGHGNAGKISIERMRLSSDANPNPDGSVGNPDITAGIDLGGGDGGWGDYSDLRDIEVSNFPNAIGIKLGVNVSVMYNVWTENTHDGIINTSGGPGGSCLFAFGCGAMAFRGVGIRTSVADYWAGTEIEAPLDGSTPVEMAGSSTIAGIFIGPPNSLYHGKPCHFKAMIKVTTQTEPGIPGGWHGGSPPAVSQGWSVTGLVIDNSSARADNTWDNIIEVDGVGVEASWSNASSLTVSECLRLGDTLTPKCVPSANALYIDPETKKLCFRDGKGAVHPLYDS